MDIGLQSILKIFYVGIPKMNKDSIQSELVRFEGGLSWPLFKILFGCGQTKANEPKRKQTNMKRNETNRGTPRKHLPPLSFIFFDPPSFSVANFLTNDANMKTKLHPAIGFGYRNVIDARNQRYVKCDR